MSVETKSEVEQFLVLQGKSELELRSICEGVGLKAHGSHQDMIDKILELNITQQNSVLVPQAIPLRTRGNQGEPLEAAIDTFRQWRKLIFEAKGNIKEFSLLNGKGKSYTANLKYIKCSEKTLLHILKGGWCLPLESHRDLMSTIKKEPSKFTTSIIQKPDSNGKSWLMLHVQANKAA